MKKYIIKYKIVKKNLYRRTFQRMANGIIEKLKNAKTDYDFDHWYSLGHQLDIWAKSKNIYLK